MNTPDGQTNPPAAPCDVLGHVSSDRSDPASGSVDGLRRRFQTRLLAGLSGAWAWGSSSVLGSDPVWAADNRRSAEQSVEPGTESHASATSLRDERAHAQADPAYRIRLPHDHGPHPTFRTEWWYFTGWFQPAGPSQATLPNTAAANALGIQLTFFRNAPRTAMNNPSRLAPTQLLFAHVALAQRQRGLLLHDQIARRVGLADTRLASADTSGAFELRIGAWQLARRSDGEWHASIRTRQLALECKFSPTQGEWLQGRNGFSRKGPRSDQASHYITLPHLNSQVRLATADDQRAQTLQGITWMDHEWSSTVLDERAAGWDWVGLHGRDGSALMAFRIRPRSEADTRRPATGGSVQASNADIWQHAQMRHADGRLQTWRSVWFEALSHWTSPRTGTRYPVAFRLHLDDDVFELEALMPDQELDSRLSTGTVYWEGAVNVRRRRLRTGPSRAATETSTQVSDTEDWGFGYLELTGYWKPMKL